ncbi:MAG: sulfatase, partial [Kordiimonadaceae bacterium]|nr:sulfatase [Kordiimonadaceae bacterium]
GDLGSYGHPVIKTPMLDKLAADGQRWTNFYVAAAVCSPSRGALLTGKYPVRTGLYGKGTDVFFPNAIGGIPDQEITLAEALKDAGYNTAMYGKWHLGDADYALPTRHGFDQWMGLPYSNDMDPMWAPTAEELEAVKNAPNDTTKYFLNFIKYNVDPKSSNWNVPLMSSTKTSGGYQDEIIERPTDQPLLTKRYTEGTVDYINSHAGDENPFFLYLAYTMPHVPLFSSENFDGKSGAGRYGDVVTEIDWSVGQVRAALEKNGIDKNTLVVFSSDNGPWLVMDQFGGSAGLLKNGKKTTFEGGMRVPGIFWWPDTIEPAVVRDIGSVMDLYATVMKFAGADIKASNLDSIDLGPALMGKSSPRENMAFYRNDELYAYRKGQYKIHFITEGAYGREPKRMILDSPLLYHLGEDPRELFDIAADNPEIVADMMEAVAVHKSGMTIAPSIFEASR